MTERELEEKYCETNGEINASEERECEEVDL